MALLNRDIMSAAQRLYGYLLKTHWTGQALRGPDPGIRFNARAGRFIKGYLPFLPWSDQLVYMQAQGYWIFDNWLLADMYGLEQYREVALACTNYLLSAQRPEGHWAYPNPEWRDRIATVEGCFAALGLLESYARTQHEPFLTGAKKWCRYMINVTGFQGGGDRMAVNYFSNYGSAQVPNNSTLALWTLAKLAEVTGDDAYQATCAAMVSWLRHVQMPSGELPYAVGRPHFLCYQYNGFELMDLIHYHRITGDAEVRPIIERLTLYLAEGLTEEGAGRYDCHHATPEVAYYTAAIAQALSQATQLELGDYQHLVDRAYARVLSQQRPDGGFQFYSRANYRFLTDRRSYPRYLSMILNHLLRENITRRSVPTEERATQPVASRPHGDKN